MNEQLGKEKGPAPESLEDQKFRELKATMDEQARLMGEIVIARETRAEGSVRARVGPLLKEASDKTKKAMEEWLNLRKVSDERKRKGLDDTGKDLGKE